jgi:hypothetical protein
MVKSDGIEPNSQLQHAYKHRSGIYGKHPRQPMYNQQTRSNKDYQPNPRMKGVLTAARELSTGEVDTSNIPS